MTGSATGGERSAAPVPQRQLRPPGHLQLPEQGAARPAETRQPVWRVLRGRLRLGPLIVVAVYLVLVLSGATTSSMGIASMRQDPAHPLGTMIGTPRGVRSDEWLSYTPTVLGYLATGSQRATSSPLSEKNDLVSQMPNNGIGELITFFDMTIMRIGAVVPQEMLYAAFYWLPALLLALSLPPWLRRLGATPSLGWLATALILFAPATAWWSLTPLRILGFVLAGCQLAFVASDRLHAGRRMRATALAALSGIMLARTPFAYQPWVIVLALPVVLATAIWLLWDRAERWRNARVVAGAAVVAIGLAALTALESYAALRAEAGTVYPGRRTSGAMSQGFGTVFGAPNLGYLQTAPLLKGSNLSELSTGFTFCAVWALLAWVLHRRQFRWDRATGVCAVLAAFVLFWFVWSTATIPGTRHLPIANLVPAFRADQTVGFLAVLVLPLVLSRIAHVLTWRTAVACAVPCALITGIAGLVLRHTNLPTMSRASGVVGAIGVAVVVLLATRFPRHWWPAALAGAAALSLVVAANPLIFGFGDLRDSAMARRLHTIGEQARREHAYWVTDSKFLDAVTIANGVPSLSGHQTSGPDKAQWHKLDPTGRYEPEWNRGASYLQFRFTRDVTPVIVVGPTEDQLTVQVDPCRLPALGFPVAGLISSVRQSSPCLRPEPAGEWAGAPAYFYTLAAS